MKELGRVGDYKTYRMDDGVSTGLVYDPVDFDKVHGENPFRKKYEIIHEIISAEEKLTLDNNWEDIVRRYTEEIVAAKEQAISQYIMKKQQDEIDKLRKEIADLKEELEESRECEDPALRAHRNFSKVVTEIFNDREVKHSMYSAIADRERREGIPLEEDV